MERIKVAPGLRYPFYPPRPLHGAALTRANVYDFIDTMDRTHVIQPKLVGDRVILLVRDGSVQVYTCHCSAHRRPINRNKWLPMPENTLLDGLVCKKEFYPFEAVVVGDDNLARMGPEDRMNKARDLSQQVKQPFAFDTPVRGRNGFVLEGRTEWKGVVCKARNSFYSPLTSGPKKSGSWIKNEWPTQDSSRLSRATAFRSVENMVEAETRWSPHH